MRLHDANLRIRELRTVGELAAAVGAPARDIGSGISILVYEFADEGSIAVGARDSEADRTLLYVLARDARGGPRLRTHLPRA